MREQIEARLDTLRSEYERGGKQLRQLESQLAAARETLLRISGAIMVLEEILAVPASTTNADQLHPVDGQPSTKAITSVA